MKDKVTPLLIVVLVMFAFISGSLWSKVKNLEKKAETTKQETQPQQQQQEPQQPTVLGAEDQAEITKNPGAVKGAGDAKVTIVEFSEFQCPFCKKYVDDAYNKLMTNYGSKVRYIFRDYPLPFHQHAQLASEAARCALEQGKFWEYHDKLFSSQDQWTTLSDVKETFAGYAEQLGLNGEQYRSCLNTGKFTQAVKNDLALGQKVGVQGTPSFFINGTMLVGAQPYEAFKTVIDKELNK